MGCMNKTFDGHCTRPSMSFCIGKSCNYRVKTNFGEIQGMSVVALAKFLANIELKAYQRDGKTAHYIQLFKDWKDWLNTEYNSEDSIWNT